MLFEIGEKVSLLKESGVFIIVEIQTNVAIVLDEFSFERKVLRSELVKRQEIPLHGNIPKKDYMFFVQCVGHAVRLGYVRPDNWKKWYSNSERLRIISGNIII